MGKVAELDVEQPAPDRAPTSRGRGFQRIAEARIAEAAEHGRPSDEPIDYAHLRRYTLGDAALEAEVLGLFLQEAPRTLARIAAAAADQAGTADQDWIRACHTLKGSARAVGASRVAAAAHVAESDPGRNGSVRQRHVSALEQLIEEVAAFASRPAR